MNLIATVSRSQDFDRIHEPVSIVLFFAPFLLVFVALGFRIFGRSKKHFAKPLAMLVITLSIYPLVWFSFAAYVDYIPPESIDRKSSTPAQLKGIGIVLITALVGLGIFLSCKGIRKNVE